jgi:hypothetical protein
MAKSGPKLSKTDLTWLFNVGKWLGKQQRKNEK